MPAKKSKQLALVFDTETTGLVNNRIIKIDRQAEVIEFYGNLIDLGSGKVHKIYHTLIRPSKFPMSDYIIKSTHTKLTNEMLQDAPIFNEVSNLIRNLIEEAPMVISHNLSFDMEIVDIEFERLKGQLNWPIRRVCTVEATLYLNGFRLNLTKLHSLLFKEEFENAHRAESDVMALNRCAVELYKRDLI
jgi:DNA polymerase III epsilon subunit-like protein